MNPETISGDQVAKMYRKEFTHTPAKEIAREARLQQTSANLGLSPAVLRTDNRTFIEMELVDDMALAYKYGYDVDELPNSVRQQVYDLVHTLYQHGIQYVDITPYNFIEHDGKVWIIDFGHASNRKRLVPYLRRLFNEGYLHEWNADFR
jgi:tRNA A-37 threonylcarbamoyl transferase component Bud32